MHLNPVQLLPRIVCLEHPCFVGDLSRGVDEFVGRVVGDGEGFAFDVRVDEVVRDKVGGRVGGVGVEESKGGVEDRAFERAPF